MKNEAIAPDASREEAWGRPLSPFRRGPSSARAFYRVLLEYGELRADPSRVLEDHEVARLLDRIPTTTPLELPDGEPALRAVARYLERGRAALAGESDEPALFLSKSGRRLSGSDIRRRLRVWARHAAAQGAARGLPRPGSLSTTQVYTRVESARLRAAYERSHPRA